MSFVNLFHPTSKAPDFQLGSSEEYFAGINAGLLNIVRDQLSISTWLALGAIAQGALYLTLGRVALVIPATLLFWRILDAFLQANGYRHNPHMDGVINNKFSAQLPDRSGEFGNKPANGEVVVFLLGFSSNHPFGLLAPGAKETADYFYKMNDELKDNSEKYGIMGSASWLGAGGRSTSNELMTTYYFKSLQHLHDFSMSEIHREGWQWYNKTIKEHPHLAIWHEVFRAPSGNWESIYANSAPTSLAATRHRITNEKGEAKWQSPVVDAKRGVLKSSAGRMSRSDGNEHVEFEGDTYKNFA